MWLAALIPEAGLCWRQEYENEFLDHPDFRSMHNVDSLFLQTFKRGFEARCAPKCPGGGTRSTRPAVREPAQRRGRERCNRAYICECAMLSWRRMRRRRRGGC